MGVEFVNRLKYNQKLDQITGLIKDNLTL